MLYQLAFIFLAVVAVIAALGMIMSRNPVSSALWLVLDLFCIAGLYITLSAPFIGVIQVLVYAGAIMVLFLFVIMLLNLGALPPIETFDWKRSAAFIVSMLILALLVFVVAASLEMLPRPMTFEDAAVTGSASVLAEELFTRYALPLEVIGILLLAATIGAVLLARRQRLGVPKAEYSTDGTPDGAPPPEAEGARPLSSDRSRAPRAERTPPPKGERTPAPQDEGKSN